MKKIASIMACMSLGALTANATIKYEYDAEVYGHTITVTGDEKASDVVLTTLPENVTLDDVTLVLGYWDEDDQAVTGTLTMDQALPIGFVSMVTGSTLQYDNAYGATPLTITSVDPFMEAGTPSFLPEITIDFSPSEKWTDYYSCTLLTSTNGVGFQMWGDDDPVTEEALQKNYLSTLHFTLGGYAAGLEWASETGYVSSEADIAKGQIGIVLEGYNTLGSSVLLTGLKLVANVGSNDTLDTPEPTTGTLSLLALAGLCARRRRK